MFPDHFLGKKSFVRNSFSGTEKYVLQFSISGAHAVLGSRCSILSDVILNGSVMQSAVTFITGSNKFSPRNVKTFSVTDFSFVASTRLRNKDTRQGNLLGF